MTADLTAVFHAHLHACPMIAILRGITPAEVAPVGRVLWDAGFRILEVPLNSPQPFESIDKLRKALPDALIGAGTVLQVSQVHEVQAAGGQLIIAPNFNAAVVSEALRLQMLAVPGVATPSEGFAALDAGAQAIKLFPAEMIPPAAVKAMRAVLPREALLLPVGGIGAQNMADYFAAGVNGFGIGSSLYKSGKALTDLKQDATILVASCANSMPATGRF
jgi:2-dehydro-3-deoxyphosphogalactonate aldolase